jgi:hypothetical protein
LSIRRIAEKERKRGVYSFRAVLLDRDKWGQSLDRDRQIDPLAVVNGLSLVWQNPCHEGFLLRHLEGNETARPATSDLAMQDLKRAWPEYYKAMPASLLAARIDKAAFRRVSAVEQQFTSFLDQIGMTRKW